jgi:hypothetical protein
MCCMVRLLVKSEIVISCHVTVRRVRAELSDIRVGLFVKSSWRSENAISWMQVGQGLDRELVANKCAITARRGTSIILSIEHGGPFG